MANLEYEKKITENAEAAAETKVRKKRFDIIALAMLVLIVAAALLGLTFSRTDNRFFGSAERVMASDDALPADGEVENADAEDADMPTAAVEATVDAEDFVRYETSAEGTDKKHEAPVTVTGSGTINGATGEIVYNRGNIPKEQEWIYKVENRYVNDDGNYVFVTYDGEVIVKDKETFAYSAIELDLDKELGTVPASEADAMNKAFGFMSDTAHAYNASGSVGVGSGRKTYNTNYYHGTGSAQTGTYDWKKMSRTGNSRDAWVGMYIGSTTWYYFLSGGMSLGWSHTCSYDVDYWGSYVDGTRTRADGWGGGGTRGGNQSCAQGSPSTGNVYYVWYGYAYCKNKIGLRAKICANITNCSVTMRSTSTGTWNNFKLTTTYNGPAFEKSRSASGIIVYMQNNIARLYGAYFYYVNGSGTYTGYPVTFSGTVGATSAASPAIGASGASIKSGLYAIGYSCVSSVGLGSTGTGTYSTTFGSGHGALALDSGAPVITSYFISTSNDASTATACTTNTNARTLYFHVKCYDQGGVGSASGIKYIKLVNNRQTDKPLTKTNTFVANASNSYVANGSYSGGTVTGTTVTYVIGFDTKTYLANGAWTCYVEDYAGTSPNSATKTDYSFYKHDGVAPDATKINVLFTATDNVKFTANGVSWSSTMLNLIVTASDESNTVSSTYKDEAEIKTITVAYTVNGTGSFSVANAAFEDSSTGAKEIIGTKNTSTAINQSHTDGRYSKRMTYKKFRYDPNTLSSLTITVADAAGNSSSKTFSTSELSASTVAKGRLDTVAPNVTSFTLGGTYGNAANAGEMKNWVSGDVTLSVSVKDYAVTETGYYNVGTGSYNNGSGVKSVYFYADKALTKPLNVNGTNKIDISNSIIAETNAYSTVGSVLATIRYDTANSIFNANDNKNGNIYVVVEDYCGNKSDGSGSKSGSTEGWSLASPYSGGKAGTTLWPGAKAVNGLRRDTFSPQIVVRENNASGNIIASTNGLNSTTKKYTFEWTTATSRTIHVQVYYGGSGGSLSAQRGSTTVNDAFPATVAKFLTGGTSVSSSSSGVISDPVGKSTTGGATFTSYNSASYTITLGDKGQNDYKLSFTAGTGIQTDEIVITNRIDYDPPTVTLKGFSSGEITNSIPTLISPSTLLDKTDGWYKSGSAGLWAVFQIVDSGSGVLYNSTQTGTGTPTNATIKYGKDGTAKEQKTVDYAKSFERIDGTSVGATNNSIGYRLEFKYNTSLNPSNENGTDYTYYSEGVARYISGGYYVTVKMFDLATLGALKANGTGATLYNSSTQTYNVASTTDSCTYLRYKLGVSDFLGNVGYASFSNADNYPNKEYNTYRTWDPRVLRFYVDPFPFKILESNFYEWKNSSFDSSAINDSTYISRAVSSGNAASYTLTDNRETISSWAKFDVVCELKLATGISGYKISAKYQDMTGKYDVNTGKSTFTGGYGAMSGTMQDAFVKKNTVDGKSAWIIFDPQGTKDIKVAFSLVGNNGSANQKSPTNAYVRQDKSVPILKEVFLSDTSVFDDAVNKKMLSFNAANDGAGNYSFTLNIEKSKAYDPSLNWIYSKEKLYVYMCVTDKPDKLEGSGIGKVQFGSEECSNYQSSGSDVSLKIYRTSNRYAFDSLANSDAKPYAINVEDKLKNSMSATYGGNAKVVITENGTSSAYDYRTLPILDTCDPYVHLSATNPAYINMETSAGYEKTTADAQVPYYYFKGTSISNSRFTATISFNSGISGLTLYLRKKSFGNAGKNRLSAFEYNKLGNSMPEGYDYKGNGWGYYDYTDNIADNGWIGYSNDMASSATGGSAYKYKARFHDRVTLKGEQSGSITLFFYLESVKESLELLAVSGTGKYYIIDLGDLFIDTAPPVVHNGMTIFSVAESGDNATSGGSCDFGSMQTIWTNVVGKQYTNGAVNVYFYITDPASGINDQTVTANSTRLVPMTVTGVRVWTVDGVATTIRILDGETKPTLGKNGKLLTINGHNAYTLTGEKILHKDSVSIGKATYNLTFYKLYVPESVNISVTATDLAGNTTPKSTVTEHTPAIDLAEVKIKLTAKAGTSAYDGSKYTNKAVEMVWRGDYGASGFGGFDVEVRDMFESIGDVNLPKLEKNNEGKVTMTYKEPKNNGAPEIKSKRLDVSWRDGLLLSVNKITTTTGENNETVKYYWFVDGENTLVEVNEIYGTPSNLVGLTWSLYGDYVASRYVLGVPQFTKVEEGGALRIAMTYYPKGDNQTISTTILSDGVWREGFGVSVSRNNGKYTWFVNGKDTGIEVNPDKYGFVGTGSILSSSTWAVYSTYIECTRTVSANKNKNELYTVTSYNNVVDAYAIGRVRPSATATFNVKIDIDKPVIDMTSGNMPELTATDVWHALAKSVRISIYDELSGLAKTSMSFSPDDPARVTDKIENAKVTFETSAGTATYYLIKDSDGLYRAYDVKIDGNYYARNGLLYLDDYVEYTITVYDEAGNEETKIFKPQIDKTMAKIDGNIELYVTNGTAKLDDDLKYAEKIPDGANRNEYYQMIKWVDDIAINRVTWADNNIYAKIKVVYGDSGFCLQYRAATGTGGLAGNVWTTVSEDEYEILDEVGTTAEGLNTVTLIYRFDQTAKFNFMYYRFRVISKAQNTELTKYKSFKDSTKPRGTSDSTSTYIRIELEACEAADKRYNGKNGYALVTLSSTVDTGLVAFDKVGPEASIKMEKKQLNASFTDYGVKVDDYSITVPDGLWSNGDIRMTLTMGSDAGSGFASGNVVYYRSSKDGENWSVWVLVNPANGKLYELNNNTGKWTEQGSAGNIALTATARKDATEAVTMSYYMSIIRYTIADSRNNELFEFYVENGAGQRTDVYHFGTINEGRVHGIKIDKETATVTVTAADTFKLFEDGATNSDYEREYNAMFSTSNYTANESAEFTSKNTVIIALQIAKISYSGITIYRESGGSKKIIDTVTYDEFVDECALTGRKGIIYRYYVVSKNGETVDNVYTESVAGNRSAPTAVYVRMDNTTPILYIESINGQKATNWGNTDNLYTTQAEYWYTGTLTIKFGVGVVEHDVYKNEKPYSRYTIEYKVDNANWQALGKNEETGNSLSEWKIDGISIVNKATYRFRIVSSSGMKYTVNGETKIKYMEYEIGGSVINNEGNETYNGVLNGTGGDIDAACGIVPITGHVIKNGMGDYDDGSCVYVFSVDSNTYYYEYTGKVDLGSVDAAGKVEYDVNTSNFTTYVTRVADGRGGFSATATKGFKRGDIIEIEYTARSDGKDYSAPYNYFQNYTVSTAYYLSTDAEGNEESVVTRSITHNYVNDMYNRLSYDSNPNNIKNLEKTGKIRVQFESCNIEIVSYFIAEVEVEYGIDVFYLQTEQTSYQTEAKTKYVYNDGQDRTVNINLVYEYYNYFTDVRITTPRTIGAYYVICAVEERGGSFRVEKDWARKDFVIKYFTPDKISENEYDVTDNEFEIYNANDFGYIDKTYYNLGADGKVDETQRTYLMSNFNLNEDILVPTDLTGSFKGTFNGNNHTITVRGGEIKDNYGLFKEIGNGGKVMNVTVKANEPLLVNAQEAITVGLLARNMLGGTVESVSVIADVVLNTFRADSYFGGVVGYAQNANIGGDDYVFTDVRVTNNGRAMNKVYVGGVVGYMSGTTSLSGLYAFGEIELYNVENVYAGIVYGGANGSAGYSVESSIYFDKNTFINGDSVQGMSTCGDNVEIIGTVDAGEYAEFVCFDSASPTIGGTTVSTEILTRLYSDFGYEYDGNNSYGVGIAADGNGKGPLVISSYEQILAINGYMNLHFVFASSAKEIDMSAYKSTVAVTKVFQGTLSTENGGYVKLVDFAGSNAEYTKNNLGLFGQLDGKVENIIFSDIGIDIDYVGEGKLVAGLVAAKAYENAVIKNIIMIGTETVRAVGGTVEIGGLVGVARGAFITDVFSVNVIKVDAAVAAVGGLIASVEGTVTLPAEIEGSTVNEGSIILLGRVESRAESNVAGAAIGAVGKEATVVGGSKVFAIYDNLYYGGMLMNELPVGSTTDSFGINTVDFSNDKLRGAGFASVRGVVFDYVFGVNDALYPIKGKGNSASPFIINNENDFGRINLILYADYRIDRDISFENFSTIGEGLVFSGTLKGGSSDDDISAEAGRIISLSNVKAPLVYSNSGKINDLSVNVEYTAEVKAGTTFRYGAIAIINDGEIKNVTVSGNVEIISESQDTTLYVSGFVAESKGGKIEGDKSKLQNSISALNIVVRGGGAVYTGGYAAVVSSGNPSFSYGIATGSINVIGARITYAGLLVGACKEGKCEWVLGEAASINYTYDVTVDGKTIPKYDDDDNPLVENFYGLIFGQR